MIKRKFHTYTCGDYKLIIQFRTIKKEFVHSFVSLLPDNRVIALFDTEQMLEELITQVLVLEPCYFRIMKSGTLLVCSRSQMIDFLKYIRWDYIGSIFIASMVDDTLTDIDLNIFDDIASSLVKRGLVNISCFFNVLENEIDISVINDYPISSIEAIL